MIVIGIDGGMVRLGLGAVAIQNGDLDLITYGLISNSRNDDAFNAFLTRGITQIANDFPRFIDLVRPDVIFSETIPVGKLGSSDSQVVAAVTTCHVLAIQFGIEWRNIAANTVKKELTGDYRASKTLVRNTILDMFPDKIALRHAEEKRAQKEAGEKKRPGLPQDVFDAVAVATIGARIVNGKNQEEAMQGMQST